MSARDEIFATLRRSLGVKGTRGAARRTSVEERLRAGAAGRHPGAGAAARATRCSQLFKTQAEAAMASVVEVGHAPPTCRTRSPSICALATCRARIRMGDDLRLAAMPWAETTLEVAQGPQRRAATSSPSTTPSRAWPRPAR